MSQHGDDDDNMDQLDEVRYSPPPPPPPVYHVPHVDVGVGPGLGAGAGDFVPIVPGRIFLKTRPRMAFHSCWNGMTFPFQLECYDSTPAGME